MNEHQSTPPRSTTVCFINDDAYEIIYSPAGVHSIVRYARGVNSRGTEVDFDALPSHIQHAIFRHLRYIVERQRRRLNANRTEPETDD